MFSLSPNFPGPALTLVKINRTDLIRSFAASNLLAVDSDAIVSNCSAYLKHCRSCTKITRGNGIVCGGDIIVTLALHVSEWIAAIDGGMDQTGKS